MAIARSGGSGVVRGGRGAQVRLADLNLDFFEDEVLADDMAGQCLKLFEETGAEFTKIREQAWYKKLWFTLTGGNTRKLAMGCRSLAEAQTLLVEVLQVHARTNAHSQVLMQGVAKGLVHMEHQLNDVVRTILAMDGRVDLLEQETALHRRQLNADPSIVATWNQERKLLLYKVMVLGAFADGRIDDFEEDLLSRNLKQFALTGAYLDEANEFIGHPELDSNELERIDSYQTRLTIFRHALGIMYADGKLEPAERTFAKAIAKSLHLREADESKIRDAFSEMHGEPNVDRLEMLLGGGSKRRAPAPDAEEYKELDARREALHAAERAHGERIAELRDVGARWAAAVAEHLAFVIVVPALQTFEAYGSLPDDCTVEDMVATMDSQTIRSRLAESIEEGFNQFVYYSGDIEVGFEFPMTLVNRLEPAWYQAVKDNVGLPGSLEALRLAGEDVVASNPSVAGAVMQNGLLGAAAGFLLGPVGIVGAVGYSLWEGDSKDKDFQRAALRWERAVQGLGESVERWQKQATAHIHGFLVELLSEVEQHVSSAETADAAAMPVLRMLHHLEGDDESSDSAQVESYEGIECPGCGRSCRGPACCEFCGTGLPTPKPRYCTGCGQRNNGTKFCEFCGTAQ